MSPARVEGLRTLRHRCPSDPLGGIPSGSSPGRCTQSNTHEARAGMWDSRPVGFRSTFVIVRERQKTPRKPEESPEQAQSSNRGFARLTLYVNSVSDSGP